MAAQAQVEIVLATDGVEGDVYGIDKNGKRVDLPHRIIVKPYFFGSMAQANLAYITVGAGPRELGRVVLQLSGATGKTKLLDRSNRHDPKFVSQLTDVEGFADSPEATDEGEQEFYNDEQEAEEDGQ